jgi:hypothetical protein
LPPANPNQGIINKSREVIVVRLAGGVDLPFPTPYLLGRTSAWVARVTVA